MCVCICFFFVVLTLCALSFGMTSVSGIYKHHQQQTNVFAYATSQRNRHCYHRQGEDIIQKSSALRRQCYQVLHF